MAIDSETLERHGLIPAEYDKILDILGREPSITASRSTTPTMTPARSKVSGR